MEKIIEINGIKIKGTTKEICILLRKEPYKYSMTKIAGLLNQTRSNVSRLLKGTGYEGQLKKEKKVLEKENYNGLTDKEVSKKYSLAITYVSNRRRELKVKPKKVIASYHRQTLLCRSLFGDNYLPGKDFKVGILWLMNRLGIPEDRQEIIENFYFNKGGSTQYQKLLRSKIKGQIKLGMKYELVHQSVIIRFIRLNYIKEII